MTGTAPTLEGQSKAAVDHRGSHLQIIAAAGSGKTEVVSQRVASLIAENVPASSIVAFTFTERAAEELKNRITKRVVDQLGNDAVDRLSGMYVGTIHGYCFQFLQQVVPKYETYDVVDEGQHVALLCREATRLKIKELSPKGALFHAIGLFNRSMQVIENELLEISEMPDPFGRVLREYREMLDKYRLMTFGMQIARAVEELQQPKVRQLMQGRVRHLIVDEYQDVNPAQERLVALLAELGATVCVVGDDDQAIYQWRGSDVGNIVRFVDRYPNVATFTLDVNRRSLPAIVATADEFAKTIRRRLNKSMKSFRVAEQGNSESQIVAWTAATEQEEAEQIADSIARLHQKGLPYSEIAILVRGSTAYPKILAALAERSIPVQPGGRSGLFAQPEASCLGQLFCFLGDVEWAAHRAQRANVTQEWLVKEFAKVFSLDAARRHAFGDWLSDLQGKVPRDDRVADLVGETYELLEILGLREWDLLDPLTLNRMGTIARFTNLLADYETVRRRARPDAEAPGEQVGGQDRGSWYYKNLGIFIVNYAVGEYDGFEGEDDFGLDAVDLTTVHSAKGLEWPAVFIPSLTANRFPSSRSGSEGEWLVPRNRFNASRYEGDDADERRLFYVALTRGRDLVVASRHERVTTRTIDPSPYWGALGAYVTKFDQVRLPTLQARDLAEADLLISYSELAAYMECGWAYRLRQSLGFMPRLVAAIGYGRAVHHVMRVLAEETMKTGRVPSADAVQEIINREFFLPTANKVAHRELKTEAERLVTKYIKTYGDELRRVWMTERPFELHLDGVTVNGRADVILDGQPGNEGRLTIVDYKTAAAQEEKHELQLQIYLDAGRREGLDVADAFVHDMKSADRIPIDSSDTALKAAEETVKRSATALKKKEYKPNPEIGRCTACDVRTICPHSAAK
jgi:DNA helicase-2/ATP-dependent DNA helicase PcrA